MDGQQYCNKTSHLIKQPTGYKLVSRTRKLKILKKYFFPLEFISVISVICNYYKFVTAKITTVPSQLSRWKDVEPAEFCCCLACSLLMPRVKQLEIDEYWAKDVLLLTPIFPQIMATDRFTHSASVTFLWQFDPFSREPCKNTAYSGT